MAPKQEGRPPRLPQPQTLEPRPTLTSQASSSTSSNGNGNEAKQGEEEEEEEYDTQPTLAYNRVQFQHPPTNNHPQASTSSNPHPAYTPPTPTPQPQQPNTSFSASNVARKKSLVRPDRERLDENHRLYNFRAHAAAMQAEGRGFVGVSRTGHTAFVAGTVPGGLGAGIANQGGNEGGNGQGTSAFQDASNLRRGKSILAREAGEADESGLSMFKRRAPTLRRPNNQRGDSATTTALPGGAYEMRRKAKAKAKAKKQPLGPWMIYCLILTIFCPSPLLKCFGLRSKERQSAWREKMGLLGIIALSMTAVGFLTFGLQAVLCGQAATRYLSGDISTGSMIFHGYNYDLSRFAHPAAAGIEGGSNPLYNAFASASMDGSFLFQNVNQNCLDIITPARGTGIPTQGNRLGWYFPCNLYNQWGSSAVNKTGYAEGALCHTQTDARTQFGSLKPTGQVYFNWNQLTNSTRNLGVYNGNVLDFSLLQWLDVSQVAYPPLFDQIKNGNSSYRTRDITSLMVATNQQKLAECMVDIIRVGFIDASSIGCITSFIILYVSLAVIIGVVMIRFAMAVIFGWFLSWKIGKFPDETYEQRMQRSLEIERWTADIYRPAPAKYRPTVKNHKKTMLPTTSRFSKADLLLATGGTVPANGGGGGRPESKFGESYRKSMVPSMLGPGMKNSPPGSPVFPGSRSSTSLPIPSYNSYNFGHGSRPSTIDTGIMGSCPFPLGDVVPQPPTDFEPFNYPLAHTFLLVTAYSESTEGLRTTLDSLATTDYPNSHKCILVIADGMVKGSGNNLSTPEIALGMMKELIVPSDDVEPQSYVAIADGHKRHNRAKVYAGWYDYDDNTVEGSKQQRVPMILLAKIGNESETKDAKPGNRGKRDSQIMLMSFLQKVMFDERMSTFEYEFFNSIWRCTGVSPDLFQMVLMVDADTKVFPDSVSRMVSCLVNDPEIMGLCGETKIANKTETWVTMIQVFEYYVSHHLTKAFESVFGGVTCLPGCFSMYRIKSPKGGEGYWVPILANPDIVEHYSENVVDTLHKKNLLLLGEDRFLTTLMLRTFPRRKMMFCPQAVCKTVVPDTFRVLLSQRRRWINSTVHNLFELITVPDLCGVFCFSMRFVVFMELAGTLVLPAAISFTYYLIVLEFIPGSIKPTLPLILLAFILGIPAVLIALTSPRKYVFFGWMLIYLLSLPVWNFILPGYAFLHMDDFSWGETRKIIGDGGGNHGDKDGEFDSSHIVMKRWADFERERRYRGGVHTRDSTYDMHLSNSPRNNSSNRYSAVSSVETFNSMAGPGIQGDNLLRRSSPGVSTSNGSEPGHQIGRYPVQLELPAPLAVSAPRMYENFNRHVSDVSLPTYPQPAGEDYPRYASEGYDSDELDREALTHGLPSPPVEATSFNLNSRPEREQPLYSEPESISSHERSISSNSTLEPPDAISNNPYATHLSARKSRGVSLVDAGPVPGTEGVRVVQRQRESRRSSGGLPPPQAGGRAGTRNSTLVPLAFSPTDLPSPSGSLPPGAAPPRTQRDL